MDTTEKPKAGQKTTERMAPVTTNLEIRDHVRLLELARQHDRSVSSLVRAMLKVHLRPKD